MVFILLLTFATYNIGGEISEDENQYSTKADESGELYHKRSQGILSRPKRYALQGSRWTTNEITYRISKYSTKLPKKTVDKLIRKALMLWEEVTNLKFVEQKNEIENGKKVKFNIRFETGEHGDDAPFDGEGGFRAHAFFPGFGGDLHLDDDENWTDESRRDGVRLLLVAAHEIGHALGVGHSDNPNALMAPSHKEWNGEVKLMQDDINAIQGLYGKPGEGRPLKPDPALGKGAGPMIIPGGGGRPPFNPGGVGRPPFNPRGNTPFFPPQPPPIPAVFPPDEPNIIIRQRPGTPIRDELPGNRRKIDRKPNVPDYDYDEYSYEDPINNEVDVFDVDESFQTNDPFLCNGGSIDAMTTINDKTYVFKADKYWKLADSEAGVADGYPRRINSDWRGLPNNIDAAFTWKNGKSYIFKGSKYWRFSSIGKLDSGFPKQISDGFEGIPNNIDSAFVWNYNGKIYFFKGTKYWKFDPNSDPPVQESYPRPIANWDGVPSKLDAALQYKNGNSYFFKNNKYYRFNSQSLAVERSYPRNTGEWWFGCSQVDSPRKLRKEQDIKFILD